jgi:hypothetical protein
MVFHADTAGLLRSTPITLRFGASLSDLNMTSEPWLPIGEYSASSASITGLIGAFTFGDLALPRSAT